MKPVAETFEVKTVFGQSVEKAIAALDTKFAKFAEENADKTDAIAANTATLASLKAINWKDVPFTWKQAENKAEAIADYTDAELTELVNSARKTAAKSKEYQRVITPFKPDVEDPAVVRAASIKMFMLRYKMSQQAAEAMADSLAAQATEVTA